MGSALWGMALLLEGSPGSNINRCAEEAVALANGPCYYESPRLVLCFNDFLMRLDKNSTADSIVRDYYDQMERARKRA